MIKILIIKFILAPPILRHLFSTFPFIRMMKQKPAKNTNVALSDAVPTRQPHSIKLFVVTVLWKEPISVQHSVGLCGMCHGDPPGVV